MTIKLQRLLILILCCIMITIPIISSAAGETKESPFIYSSWYGLTQMQGALIYEWVTLGGENKSQTINCPAGTMTSSGRNINVSITGVSQINWSVGIRLRFTTTTPQYISQNAQIRSPGQGYTKNITLEYISDTVAGSYIDTYTSSSTFWAIMSRLEVHLSSGSVPTPIPTPTPTPSPTSYGWQYPYTPPPISSGEGTIEIPDVDIDASFFGSIANLFWGVLGPTGIMLLILIIAVGLLIILLK